MVSQVYIEVDGVAVGFLLALILADIFMVELERSLIPNLIKNKFGDLVLKTLFALSKLVNWIHNISVEHIPQKHSIYLWSWKWCKITFFRCVTYVKWWIYYSNRYIEKRVIQMCIYIGTVLCQYHGREGHWKH